MDPPPPFHSNRKFFPPYLTLLSFLYHYSDEFPFPHFEGSSFEEQQCLPPSDWVSSGLPVKSLTMCPPSTHPHFPPLSFWRLSRSIFVFFWLRVPFPYQLYSKLLLFWSAPRAVPHHGPVALPHTFPSWSPLFQVLLPPPLPVPQLAQPSTPTFHNYFKIPGCPVCPEKLPPKAVLALLLFCGIIATEKKVEPSFQVSILTFCVVFSLSFRSSLVHPPFFSFGGLDSGRCPLPHHKHPPCRFPFFSIFSNPFTGFYLVEVASCLSFAPFWPRWISLLRRTRDFFFSIPLEDFLLLLGSLSFSHYTPTDFCVLLILKQQTPTMDPQSTLKALDIPVGLVLVFFFACTINAPFFEIPVVFFFRQSFCAHLPFHLLLPPPPFLAPIGVWSSEIIFVRMNRTVVCHLFFPCSVLVVTVISFSTGCLPTRDFFF